MVSKTVAEELSRHIIKAGITIGLGLIRELSVNFYGPWIHFYKRTNTMAYDIINLISATGFCNFYLVPARPLQTNLSHFSLVNDNTLFPVESNLPAAVPL